MNHAAYRNPPIRDAEGINSRVAAIIETITNATRWHPVVTEAFLVILGYHAAEGNADCVSTMLSMLNEATAFAITHPLDDEHLPARYFPTCSNSESSSGSLVWEPPKVTGSPLSFKSSPPSSLSSEPKQEPEVPPASSPVNGNGRATGTAPKPSPEQGSSES